MQPKLETTSQEKVGLPGVGKGPACPGMHADGSPPDPRQSQVSVEQAELPCVGLCWPKFRVYGAHADPLGIYFILHCISQGASREASIIPFAIRQPTE